MYVECLWLFTHSLMLRDDFGCDLVDHVDWLIDSFVQFQNDSCFSCWVFEKSQKNQLFVVLLSWWQDLLDKCQIRKEWTAPAKIIHIFCAKNIALCYSCLNNLVRQMKRYQDGGRPTWQPCNWKRRRKRVLPQSADTSWWRCLMFHEPWMV